MNFVVTEHRIFFSPSEDAAERICAFTPCGHTVCEECAAEIQQRRRLSDATHHVRVCELLFERLDVRA